MKGPAAGKWGLATVCLCSLVAGQLWHLAACWPFNAGRQLHETVVRASAAPRGRRS